MPILVPKHLKPCYVDVFSTYICTFITRCFIISPPHARKNTTNFVVCFQPHMNVQQSQEHQTWCESADNKPGYLQNHAKFERACLKLNSVQLQEKANVKTILIFKKSIMNFPQLTLVTNYLPLEYKSESNKLIIHNLVKVVTLPNNHTKFQHNQLRKNITISVKTDATVTLKYGHSHSKWYKWVKLNGWYHHAMFSSHIWHAQFLKNLQQ